MNNMQRRSYRLLLHLHPPSFRNRFAEEMLLDYQDLLRDTGALQLTADLIQSLAKQWIETLLSGLCSRPAEARPAFLTGNCALEFHPPMSPLEVARGFALSVLLFTTFWSLEDPTAHPGDLLRLLASASNLSGEQSPAHHTSGPKELEIRDVTIVDTERGSLLSHRTVLIEDGTVTSVSTSESLHTKPGVDVLDGHSRFLIPGLWDMHTHITHTDVDFPLYIANGVLGIRSMGGVQDQVFAWQKQLKDGALFGPMAFVSGPILDGPKGPVHPAEYGVRIANAEEGRAEVDNLRAQGADFVKVYDGLSRDSYFAIAAEANRIKLPFAGHVPGRVTILEAVHAGQRSIEHGIEQRGESSAEQDLIDRRGTQDFMAEAIKTGNFSLIPEGIARDGDIWLKHFSQARADLLYRTLAKSETYLCPTLVTQHWVAYGDELSGKPDVRTRFIDPGTLVYWQPSMNMLTKYRTPAYIAWVKVRYAKYLQQVPRQEALGVQLLAGTDLTVPFTYPGSSVHDEVRLMASTGMTNLQALQTATTHPVDFFGLQKTLGSIAVGKRAEFVLLDGNPLADLSNLDRIEAVITHGKILRRPELDSMTDKAAKAVQNKAQHSK
jgi:imidazolonepropionase-like amidohydrolase